MKKNIARKEGMKLGSELLKVGSQAYREHAPQRRQTKNIARKTGTEGFKKMAQSPVGQAVKGGLKEFAKHEAQFIKEDLQAYGTIVKNVAATPAGQAVKKGVKKVAESPIRKDYQEKSQMRRQQGKPIRKAASKIGQTYRNRSK